MDSSRRGGGYDDRNGIMAFTEFFLSRYIVMTTTDSSSRGSDDDRKGSNSFPLLWYCFVLSCEVK